jgi:hypothetical protein
MKNKRTMLHVIFKFMKNESRISNLVEEHEARTLSRGRNGWAHGLPPAPSRLCLSAPHSGLRFFIEYGVISLLIY